MSRYQALFSRVDGGMLAGGSWNADSGGMPIVAVHGITSSHLAWAAVARFLPGTPVIAPDLRGRGRSRGLPGPSGLNRHADDLARMLDELAVERAMVAGHSMGGFVAVRLAERHPHRVAGLVLIDGGLPLPVPEGLPEENRAAALLGPAGARLTQRYASREEYRAFWRAHPAFGDWNEDVERYVDYDLVEDGDAFRSAARYDAVATDILQLDGSDGYTDALAGLPRPIDFLHAPRGLLNEVPPLYPDDRLAAFAEWLPSLRVHEVVDVNHYTILLSQGGASVVAAVLADRLAARSDVPEEAV